MGLNRKIYANDNYSFDTQLKNCSDLGAKDELFIDYKVYFNHLYSFTCVT